ncbi:MAG TPA: HAD family hydrolase [Elusimicrobia bacterium]|nr:HAD family hydrolase [Elusimicrobiota bacterium]HBT60127.1 HAD family hydrolase [Elusimicrobiota bacterium]
MKFPQSVFFDCDGVILESVNIKTEAFRDLFSDTPEHGERMTRFHLANLGVSRYDKFRYYYDEVLRRPMPEGEMERLDKEFSRLVFERILSCPMVEGAEEFFETHSRRCPMFIVSASPEPELRRIIEARGLSRHFAGVFGSPKSKTQNVRDAVGSRKLDPERCAFVGDAEADWKAAKETGIPFIARLTPGKEEFWQQAGVAQVPNLVTLAEALSRLS